MITRRQALMLIAGAAFAARAGAQAAKPLRVSWFSEGTLLKHKDYIEAFRARMRELGYAEGRNLAIDYYWRGDTVKTYRWLASDIARSKPDVIVATCELTAAAAKGATDSIPIVMTLSTDPVAFGLAKSLSRPGGNLTGVSGNVIELHAKRLELLREIAPRIERVALLRPKAWPQSGVENAAIRDAAGRLKISLVTIEIGDDGNLEPALAALRASRAQGMLDLAALSVNGPDLRAIAELPTRAGIPAVFFIGELADAGGLSSYGPNARDGFRRAAGYVDRLAKGAKAADLPIEQPDRFELVVNLKTAKQLGITVPQSVLLRADRMIE